MLNDILRTCIEEATPAIVNKHITKGIATTHLNELGSYMNRFLKGVFRGGANRIQFQSITKCGVHETIKQLRDGPPSTLQYDVTVSDLVMYRIKVLHNGVPMDPKYIYLPFSRVGGLMLISGSVYCLTSVLSDKSLSPSSNGVFMRLFRGKINVNALTYFILRNNDRVVTKVLTANIYSTKVKYGVGNQYTKSKTGPMLYLLAHYGFSATMMNLLGWIPTILMPDDPVPEGYTVYASVADKPMKTYIGDLASYNPVTARLAVPKDCDVAVIRNTIGNFYYILDHFPNIKVAEWDSTDTWKITLGRIICGRDSAGKLMATVSKHMLSLDNYVDSFMVDKIHDEFNGTLDQDFTEDGFFKVLTVIMQRFDSWTMAADEITASTLDKRFETLYYLLYELIKRINSFSFDIEQKHDNYGSTKNIIRHFNKKVTRGRIFAIRNKNVACSPVTYSGDNAYFKITSRAELQLSIPTASSSKTSTKARSVGAANATTTLHETQVYTSTLNAITIDRLSPVTYLNIFAPYDPVTRTFIPTQEMLDDTKPLQTILKAMPRRSSSPQIPKEFDIHSDITGR